MIAINTENLQVTNQLVSQLGNDKSGSKQQAIYAQKDDPMYDKAMDSDNDGVITMDEFNTYCDDNGVSSSQKKDMLKTMMEYQLNKQLGVQNGKQSQQPKMPQFELSQPSRNEEFYDEEEVADFFRNFDYDSYMEEAEGYYGYTDEPMFPDDFMFDDSEGYQLSDEDVEFLENLFDEFVSYFGEKMSFDNEFMFEDFDSYFGDTEELPPPPEEAMFGDYEGFELSDEDMDFLENLFNEFISYFDEKGTSLLGDFFFGDDNFESYFDNEEISNEELQFPPEFENIEFNNSSQETFNFNNFKQASGSYTKPVQNLANAKIELRV